MFNLLLFLQITFCQEISLERIKFKEANISEQVTSQNQIKCPLELENQEFNSNNLKVICQQYDLFYMMKVNFTQGKEDFEMFIDLVSPWSWYKSPECEFYDQASINETIKKQSCWDKSYIKSQKLDQSSQIETQINAHNFSLKGNLVTSYIAIDKKQFQLEMLQVNQIFTKKLFPSDGAISMSHFLNSNVSDFIMQFSQNKKSIVQFDLSIYKQTMSIKNDIEEKINFELNWINNSNINSPQWKFKLDQISIMNKQILDANNNYEAILTLNSQFISFPKEIIDKFIEELNKPSQNISCWYADSEFYVIGCSDPKNGKGLGLNMILSIQNIQIKLTNLIGTCKKQECQLKIKCSSSKTIFLGEPFFFQDKPVLLNYETGQIGIYKEKLYNKQQDDLQFENLGTWVVILTIILILIFCLMNIKHAVKWFIRAIKYRKTKNFDDEQQLRSKEVEINEMEKAEQMTQSIEENSI
ncbi:unnamed protein product [Paramecium sonneborni]|uniref:Peptidase A1 domain-containing protein n=1 Tax=Paramecium sonneborni TaxID=65129 RepID=A0A8S1K9N4_9CILI|nr:unnamed protein product [Paramecium sonneborni]